MTGDGILQSMAIGGVCYWVNEPSTYTTWQSAKARCQAFDGSVAGILSENANANIAARLTRYNKTPRVTL